MTKFKLNILNLLIVFLTFTIFISCSNDNHEIENSNLRDVASSALRFGNETFSNLSLEEIANGNEQINQILNQSNNRSSNTDLITVDELANLYEEYLNINKEETISFFNMILENRELLLEPGAKEELIEQMKIIGKEYSEVNENNRWLFQTLYTLAGGDAHCSVGVLAAFADTVILGATAIVTAPTGVGAVVAGVGVVSSYASMVGQAINCIGE